MDCSFAESRRKDMSDKLHMTLDANMLLPIADKQTMGLLHF